MSTWKLKRMNERSGLLGQLPTVRQREEGVLNRTRREKRQTGVKESGRERRGRFPRMKVERSTHRNIYYLDMFRIQMFKVS